MVKRYAAVICLAVVLAGSALVAAAGESRSENEGVNAENSAPIDVWYVTLRNKGDRNTAGAVYGGARGELRTGICALDFIPIPGLKGIVDSAPFYIPEERTKIQDVSEWTEDRFWKGIEAFAKNNLGNIVFYIHGYNVGFEKSCRRAALFQRALNPRHRLVLFSWPADGNVLKYTWDEADLVWSVPRIAQTLQKLVLHVGSDRVDVVAHSLGTRGVVMALSMIACKQQTEPLVNELVLVAPDIDTDNFRDAWPDVRHLARRTTLYVSENDKALRASREAHGYPRLGEAGEHLTVLAGIETIDISPAGTRRFSGHIYHLYHSEVAADLLALLGTGRPAAQRPNLQRTELGGLSYWRLVPQNP